MRTYKNDLTGRTLGRLKVIRLYRRCKVGGVGPLIALWLTECSCSPGREHIVSEKSLLHPTKPAKSCGCLQAESRRRKKGPRKAKVTA